MKHQKTDILHAFSEYLLKIKGYSYQTVKSYISDLKILQSFLERQGIDLIGDEKLSSTHLRRFIALQSTLNLSPKTVARRIAAIKSFYRWAKKSGMISNNPAQALSTPKIPSNLPVFLSESEAETLFDSFNPKTLKEHRNLILFKVVYGCGLRISEALNLKISDYDSYSSQFKIKGKGKKERIIPLPYKLKVELENYLRSIRPELLEDSANEYIFPGKKENHLSDTAARKSLRNMVLSVGLSAKISPHALRHSLATHLLARGVDVRIVQEILGHSSLNTTQVYTHTDKSWLQRIYMKTHPRN
ncbi:MAG: tyrosine recombinase XerC [Actinobacteria bacterium]|nr:tyrosine recombinase XerC [Actinomycetota bacterium]